MIIVFLLVSSVWRMVHHVSNLVVVVVSLGAALHFVSLVGWGITVIELLEVSLI